MRLLPCKPRLRSRRRRTMLSLLCLLIVVLAALMLPLYIVYRPPNILILYFQSRWPDTLWHIPPSSSSTPASKQKLIALTIDDGPSVYTEEILRVLAQNDAHATFFVIGSQIPSREHVLGKMLEQGSEIANHGMHDEPAKNLPNSVLKSQILDVQTMILKTYAKSNTDAANSGVGRLKQIPRFYRPGSGFFTDRMRALVTDLGYRIVLGSVYPHDAQIGYSWINARHVLAGCRDGSIVVCHDRRGWTVSMLKIVLPELKRRGFKVLTVSELLEKR